ncbi:MAG: hypothetical protein CMF49_07030 [Legionellales bacterium]|nr:hypothetical protein [Legionellales bacterium]|tara:strand:- start:2190 stop:2834 length:645 start_codon:yes stop_codon:yes gene_type:complete
MSKLLYQNGIAGIKDKQGYYLDVTVGYCTLLGLKDPKEIIGHTDFELLEKAVGSSHYSIRMLADELLSEDAEVMRNKQQFIFDCHIFHQKPFLALVHKAPYVENNHIVGALFTAVPLISATNTQIENYINNPEISVSRHTGHFLKKLGILTPKKYHFSKRELQCIHLLAKGCSAYDIALELGLSKRTIEFYIRNIKTKMGVKKSTEIVAKAILQ